MKIRVEFDVTAKELRSFFGLPDVEPIQEELLRKIRDKMAAGVDGFDPVSLLKPFLPENLLSLQALQRAFQAATRTRRARPES